MYTPLLPPAFSLYSSRRLKSPYCSLLRSHGPFSLLEILQEPAGSWYWGSNAASPRNAACYARLLRQVSHSFTSAFGRNRPLLLASYDGGRSSCSDTWGRQVWAADPRAGEYIDGITFHAYANNNSGCRTALQDAWTRTHRPVYVTEVGWATECNGCYHSGWLNVSERQQARNIYGYIDWARSTGYVKGVVVFKNVDFKSNWFGIMRADLSRKPSYFALHQAAVGEPLRCDGC